MTIRSRKVLENVAEKRSRDDVAVPALQMDRLAEGLAKHVEVGKQVVARNTDTLKKRRTYGKAPNILTLLIFSNILTNLRCL